MIGRDPAVIPQPDARYTSLGFEGGRPACLLAGAFAPLMSAAKLLMRGAVVSLARRAGTADSGTRLIDRRVFMACVAGAPLAACGTQSGDPIEPGAIRPTMLVAVTEEPFPILPVDSSVIDARYHRQMVADPTGERPGTIVIDPSTRFLHLVMEERRALRYGIGVGREGFAWSGEALIQRKATWPKWTPPASMIKRQPELAQYAGGMAGGPDNPLGARALYLYEDGRDTLYRIHGTNEPRSIGGAVSSGCIRLLNVDVIDLFGRVPIGSRVVVRPPAASQAA